MILFHLKKVFRNSLVFSFLLSGLIFETSAQISDLPHTETFNKNFVLGENVEFIPNWYGNLVRKDSRIFQAEEKALAVIPTSSFQGEIEAKLDLRGYEKVAVSFKAKSVKNEDGNSRSMLYLESSFDGGISWNTNKLIHTFHNQNSDFSDFKYVLAGAASNRLTAAVRFVISTESENGKAAGVVIDDVHFFEEDNDITPPEVASVRVLNSNTIQIKFNEAMDAASAGNDVNYQGLPDITSVTSSPNNTDFTVRLGQNLENGRAYYLTISNVADESGNLIASPYTQKIIYNNSRPNLFISEIMYNSPALENDSLEFLEIYNAGPGTARLGGLYFSSGLTFTFPEYSLDEKSYMVIAANARAAQDFYDVGFLEWEEGALNNAGERLEIKNSEGQLITSVKYERTWGGDGNGHSISYCNPGNPAMNDNPLSWSTTQSALGKSVSGIPVYASPMMSCGVSIAPEIRFDSYSSYSFESGTEINIILECINPNSEPSSVTVALEAGSTAIFGDDFTSDTEFPFTQTFQPGTGKIEFRVSTQNNPERLDIRTAIFKLTNPENAVVGGRGYYELSILSENPSIAQVCINELAASNNSNSGIKDEFGDYDDWIELKNNSSSPVLLSGYYVTDNPKNLTKHLLPMTDTGKVTIPPNGYLILWADNEPNQGSNHLSFALSALLGEYFALVMPDGKTIVDSVSFPPLEPNTSYGRTEDCGQQWTVFNSPTFNSQNKPTAVIYRHNATPITLYPNPNRGDWLYISEPVSYILYDQTGKTLKRDFTTQQIDVSNLPGGIYFIQTDEGYTTKFIISR